jgi:hypothetical protein
MSEKRNSATRVRGILLLAKREPDNYATIDIWLSTFGLSKNQSRHIDFIEVTKKIQLLCLELDLIREHMRATGFNSSTYEPALVKIQNAITPEIFQGGWVSGKQQLSADVMVALDFLADLMPDEELEISANDFKSILEEISDLEETIDNSDVSDHLQAVIKQYISAIREALDQYPISGAKAIKKASQKFVGEIIEVQAELKEAQSSPAVQKFASIWKRANSVADAVIKAEKIGHIGQKSLEYIQKFLD